MAMVMSGSESLQRPYPFDDKFERGLVARLCLDPDFYARFGDAIEPGSLRNKTHKLIVEAAQAIADDLGRGPKDARTVIQRIRRWVNEGKKTFSEACEANDVFDAILDDKLPDADEIALELTPVLRKRMERRAIDEGIREISKPDGDMSKLSDLLDKAQRIGHSDESVGINFKDASLDAFSRLRKLEQFATGVVDLDLRMNGGPRRGNLAMVMGGSGAGKSVFLDHLTAFGLTNGMHVGYFTLELEEDLVFARTVANLTGIPTNDIMASPDAENAAKLKLAEMAATLGPGHVKYGTPGVTTVRDVRAWVDKAEKIAKCPMDLLVVDYADLLTAPRVDNTYQAMKVVYEQLRAMAIEKKMWVWTASQSKGRENKAILDLEDVADSMHKVRIADVVITLNPRGDGEILYHVAKFRGSEARYTVGPLPCDFSRGRIASVAHHALPADGIILDAY